MAEAGGRRPGNNSAFVSVDVGTVSDKYEYTKSQDELEFISGSYSANNSQLADEGKWIEFFLCLCKWTIMQNHVYHYLGTKCTTMLFVIFA